MANTFGATISPLQVNTSKDLKGIVDSNHTIQMFSGEPHKLDSVLAFALNYGANGQLTGNSILEYLTTGLGNSEIEAGNAEIMWKIYTSTERNYAISRVSDNTNLRGQSGSTFDLYFDTKCFSKGDVIMSEKQYQLRLTTDMESAGKGFRAIVQIFDPTQDSIPLDQIQEGVRYARLFTPVEEFSDYGGSPSWTTPAELRTHLSTLRLEQTVTRSAVTNDITRIKLYNPNTKKYDITSWMEAVDLKMFALMKQDIEYAYHYGIASHVAGGLTKLIGPNGRPILTGAGLRQQISPGNIFYHNGKLSYNFLYELLMSLSQLRGTGGGTEFIAFTGFGGQSMFNDMVNEQRLSQGITFENSTMFYSERAGKTLEFTDPLFTTVNFRNGIKLTLVINPLQNNPTLNSWKYPGSSLPVDSFRFTIFPKFTKEGKSNIVSVVKKMSGQLAWSEDGSISPTSKLGAAGKRSSGSGLDGYKLHMLTERGVVLVDPTAACEIIPNISAF